MEYRNLSLEIADRVATLTIRRPGVKNAIDLPTMDELEQAVVLTGAGGTFVSGGDLESLEALEGIEEGRALELLFTGDVLDGEEAFRLGLVDRVVPSGAALAGGRALARLRAAAEGTENLMPPILAAVEADGTVGEITGVLREVFGEFQEPRAF